MSIQPTCEAASHRRRAACILLLLSMLAAASAFALLSPGKAWSDECLGNDPSCGGGQPPPPPPPPPPGDGGGGTTSCSSVVVLYEHSSYQGQCWGFPAGQTEYVGDAADERVSSIWVADGYVATLFPGRSYTGGYHNTATSPDPWGWSGVGNDSVSSLVVQPSKPNPEYYSGAGETAAPASTGISSGSAATSGCAKVAAAVSFRTSWGRRMWRYALLTRFCWNGSAVTALWEREVAATIDGIPFPLSLIQGWRYTPGPFQPGEAGHASTVLRTDGTFEFCNYKHICLNPQHPWVRIELYRSGKAVCTTSARTTAFSCERVT